MKSLYRNEQMLAVQTEESQRGITVWEFRRFWFLQNLTKPTVAQRKKTSTQEVKETSMGVRGKWTKCEEKKNKNQKPNTFLALFKCFYAWIEHHFNPQLKSNNYNELKSDSLVLPVTVMSNEFKIQGTWMLGFVLTVIHWFPVDKIKIIKLSSTYRERHECELLKYYCDEHAAKDREKNGQLH